MTRIHVAAVVALAVLCSPPALAQSTGCDLTGMPALAWYGTERYLPVEKFAALAAPIFWFSPDEPLLERREGAEIRIPEPFPGESIPDRPVVYYQIETVLARGRVTDSVIRRDSSGTARLIDLAQAQTITISYYAYFRSEEGLGAHPHDVEPVEFRYGVLRGDDERVRRHERASLCSTDTFLLMLSRSSAKAHGLVFYWNVLASDRYVRMPMTLLVEEGKHALATDKNGDGVFTPGYDVNLRINDAWGVRDIIRTGALYSGGFESWMAKTRRPEHRVFPPLPDDSPQIVEMARMMRDRPYATYELRALPSVASAAHDPALQQLLIGKSVERWPDVGSLADARQVSKWIDDGAALKSLSISFSYDGTTGIAWSFPFFVVRHLENPMNGGYILQRMYLRGSGLDDFGWTILATRSASRWVDGYFAAGAEKQFVPDTTGARHAEWDFVLETGAKFRVNLEHSPQPVRQLARITPFWGLRFGVRNRGAFRINQLRYVLEFGAGSF